MQAIDTQGTKPFDPKALLCALIEPYVEQAAWFDTKFEEGHYIEVEDRFIRDFKTVGVTLPRLIGKYKAIAEIFQMLPDSVMVFPNAQLRSSVLSNLANPAPHGIQFRPDPSRVLTPYEVKASFKALADNQTDKIPDVKFIIVVDARYTIDNIRPGRFYQWAALKAGKDALIITVD